jgi:quinol monooxygenase YgiN
MAEVLTLIAEIRAKAGAEQRLRDELLKLVAATRTEAGCINYDLHQSLEDPRQFMFYENWSSPAAHEMHDRSPHITAFRQIRSDILDGPVKLTRWRPLDRQSA